MQEKRGENKKGKQKEKVRITRTWCERGGLLVTNREVTHLDCVVKFNN